MTLPASGPISFSQIAVELGRASTAQVSLGETAVRALAGVPTGPVSLSNLLGKSSRTYSNPLPGSGSTYADVDEGTITVSLNVGSDGSFVINGTSFGTFISSSWSLPIDASAGSSHYVAFTDNSGTLSTNDAPTWSQLTTNKSCSVKSLPAGIIHQASVTVNISKDVYGTQIVATGTFLLSAKGLPVT